MGSKEGEYTGDENGITREIARDPTHKDGHGSGHKGWEDKGWKGDETEEGQEILNRTYNVNSPSGRLGVLSTERHKDGTHPSSGRHRQTRTRRRSGHNLEGVPSPGWNDRDEGSRTMSHP